MKEIIEFNAQLGALAAGSLLKAHTDWLELIKANKLAAHERETSECAEPINHNDDFNTP